MSAFLSPLFGAGWQALTDQAAVLAGGKVYTYIAGSTTPAATWTDSTQAVQNGNPIILNSVGRLPQEVWLQAGVKYKFVITDSNNVQTGLTWDNIPGINDTTSSQTEWVPSGLTPSFVNTTSFTVPGNQVALFTVNRRLQLVNSAGTLYGYVLSATYSSPNTTVTVVLDSGVLDSGLSTVNVGLFNGVNTSIPEQYEPFLPNVTVASASTTPIGAAPSANVIVTGTTTITAFDTVSAGLIKIVEFTGALIITASSAIILPGGANITTVAGDVAIFRSNGGGNWVLVSYSSSGIPEGSTGTGLLVRQTTPTFITSVVTSSTTFAVFNTTATTINAFGAATTLNMGNASGTNTILGATTFSQTLAVTGHTTFEGVTSTGATGTGNIVYSGTPTLVSPVLGTPTSGTLTNCTIPAAQLTGTALPSTIVTSSLTSLGTITSLTATTINAFAMGGAISNASNYAANFGTGALTAGTGTFSGLITSTFDGAGNPWLTRTGATTNAAYINMANTGGTAFFGMESSAGGSIITGATGYDVSIRSPSGISFSANNGSVVQMRLASTGASFNSTNGQIDSARIKTTTGDMGLITLSGQNASAAAKLYGQIRAVATSTTAGSEAGDLVLSSTLDGSAVDVLRITSAGVTKFVALPPVFASGDKYLVMDSSGDIHVSAVGPSS